MRILLPSVLVLTGVAATVADPGPSALNPTPPPNCLHLIQPKPPLAPPPTPGEPQAPPPPLDDRFYCKQTAPLRAPPPPKPPPPDRMQKSLRSSRDL